MRFEWPRRPMPPIPLETAREGPRLWDEWAHAELLERRTVLLTGPLDETTATRVAAELMLLDAAGDERVHLHVDSAGGTLGGAFTVVDVVDLMGVPVHALCLGRAEGPALAVLAVAHHRAAGPHAHLRLCEPDTHAAGSTDDVVRFAAHHRAQLDRLVERLAAATGRPVDAVGADLRRGAYLDAQQALAAGLIDEIARPDATVHHLPRRVGFRLR